MIIDGEKYACDACVRGHRVSNCQHADRPLNHINKKGRPITQCPHCRSLRKSRASHVRCECGEKPHTKEECPHLKKDGADKGHVCCCSHGQRCCCALKKESPLGAVPESLCVEKPAKPRLVNTHSDSAMTVFANGHHKPCHHKNHEASHQRGVPYKIPRPHSIHGHQQLAQRSMEHLPSSGNLDSAYNQFLDSLRGSDQENRQIKSETGSPRSAARQRSQTLNSGLQNLSVSAFSPFSLDDSASPLPDLTDFAANPDLLGDLNTAFSLDDNLQGLSAVSADPPHVDWSSYFTVPGPAQQQQQQQQQMNWPDSFVSGPTSNPALQSIHDITTSSGAVSDVEDSAFASYAVSNPGYAESNPGGPDTVSYAQSLPDHARPDMYRTSSAASFSHSGLGGTPLNLAPPDSTGSAGFPDTSLDVESLLQGSTATLSEIDRSSSGTNSPLGLNGNHGNGSHSHLQPGTIHGFTVENAQKMAHPANSPANVDSLDVNYPHKLGGSDITSSPWAPIHDENLTAFDPSEELTENLWMK